VGGFFHDFDSSGHLGPLGCGFAIFYYGGHLGFSEGPFLFNFGEIDLETPPCIFSTIIFPMIDVFLVIGF
jgi:hypothetical protein